MWVGPIVSTPLSYGCSLTRFGLFGWMKLLRMSGTIGKMTATTRKIATGPKDSSIDQTPDSCRWCVARRTPDRSASGVGKPEGERGAPTACREAVERAKYITPPGGQFGAGCPHPQPLSLCAGE